MAVDIPEIWYCKGLVDGVMSCCDPELKNVPEVRKALAEIEELGEKEQRLCESILSKKFKDAEDPECREAEVLGEELSKVKDKLRESMRRIDGILDRLAGIKVGST